MSRRVARTSKTKGAGAASPFRSLSFAFLDERDSFSRITTADQERELLDTGLDEPCYSLRFQNNLAFEKMNALCRRDKKSIRKGKKHKTHSEIDCIHACTHTQDGPRSHKTQSHEPCGEEAEQLKLVA